MDRELVRGIIRKLTPEKKEIEVPGYTKKQVEEAFSQLVSEGIISVCSGEIYEVRDLTHLKGNTFKRPVNVVSTGEKVEMQDIIDSQKLANSYGIDSVGNDI